MFNSVHLGQSPAAMLTDSYPSCRWAPGARVLAMARGGAAFFPGDARTGAVGVRNRIVHQAQYANLCLKVECWLSPSTHDECGPLPLSKILSSLPAWCLMLLILQPAVACLRILVYIFAMADPEAASNEALRLQMEQAMELARQLLGGLVQVSGFFITADIVLLGYGISQKKSGPLLFACLTVLGIFLSLWRGFVFIVPSAYVAMYAERLLLPNHVTLVASLLRLMYPATYDRLDTALNISDIQEREQEIRRAVSFRSLLRENPALQALSVMFLVQLASFFLVLIVFNYPFF